MNLTSERAFTLTEEAIGDLIRSVTQQGRAPNTSEIMELKRTVADLLMMECNKSLADAHKAGVAAGRTQRQPHVGVLRLNVLQEVQKKIRKDCTQCEDGYNEDGNECPFCGEPLRAVEELKG